MKIFQFVLALIVVVSSSAAHALVINGKEVQDLFGYIVQILKEDAKVQQEFRAQVARNPSYRGYRPHTYSALRHLSTEDLLYGAAQGAYTAIRQNRGATEEVIGAKAEANIGMIMEMFPMLALDFSAGEELIGKMQGDGKKDYFQIYLLRRAIPGITAPSLFSEYWQESIQRHWPAFRKAVIFLLENYSTSPEAASLAMRILDETAEQDFLRWLEREPGVAAWRKEHPDAPALADMEDYAEVLAAAQDQDTMKARLKTLGEARAMLLRQTEDVLQRPTELREQARERVARLDSAYPGLTDTPIAPKATPAPGIPGPPRDDNAPLQAPQPVIGIPTLGF
ncbi:MAG: hypothetical protein GC168_18530 [Candidatus Hydrogenedens sp.]|nr:hypothetical protein [Candidatus Hydrogenedens sp.]